MPKSVTREYRSHREFAVTTPSGYRINITPTSASHIYVNAGVDVNSDSARHCPYIVIRGTEYTLSGHFHKWDDGRYHGGNQNPKSSGDRVTFDLTKANWTNYNQSSAAPTIHAKLLTEVEEFINDWARVNEQAMREAQANDLNNKLLRLEEQEVEASTKLDALRAEIADLTAQERALL